MQIKPLGFYVLVEVDEVESVTDGGIVLPSELVKKEQAVTQFGYVRAFGPTAYQGWEGCREKDPNHMCDWMKAAMEKGWSEETALAMAQNFSEYSPDNKPHHQWGVDIGDRVEFQKYEGKTCTVPGFETYRYIPDTHIIGVIANG